MVINMCLLSFGLKLKLSMELDIKKKFPLDVFLFKKKFIGLDLRCSKSEKFTWKPLNSAWICSLGSFRHEVLT